MKKIVAFLMALSTISMYSTFELWNKTTKPIWFAVLSDRESSHSADTVSELFNQLKELPAHQFEFKNIDMSKYTRLLITQEQKAMSGTLYTFNPGKYMWVRVKEEKGELIFGPQTGPFEGWRGVTERGYRLDNNVKTGDYKEQKVSFADVKVTKKVDTKITQDIGVTKKVDTKITRDVKVTKKVDTTKVSQTPASVAQKSVKDQQDELFNTVSKANREKFKSFSIEKFAQNPELASTLAIAVGNRTDSVEQLQEEINWLKAVELDDELKYVFRALNLVRKAIGEVENRMKLLKTRP